MKTNPIEIFRKYGGQLRMSEAISEGMSRYMLYSMRDKGIVEQISRGVYRLADLPPISNPDLVAVSLRFPNCIICLVSALAFHEITTQIPHEVSIAISRKSRIPTLDFPPITVHRFTKNSFEAGVETHSMDGIPVRVYNPEKTIADCFKFRNKLGMDVIIESLKLYKARKNLRVDKLPEYGRICRVEKIMQPYLEAMM
jgi:predicted transcriptional regulator of viral defense system